jgi:CDP-glucose 4,6-dehydratase
MFNNIYKDKKVFVTGHNGFKGSWLCLWLESMGAQITGYSLDPPTQPNHYDLINFKFNSIHGDLRNYEDLLSAIKQSEPDIIFHLAAQSSVLYSYNHPIETLESNLMGTANVLEACRYVSSIKAVVIITTDKCYENKEWVWGYREDDPMGGHDPYSTSKALAELITASYRRSFLSLDKYKITHHVLISSVRSGNVLGGGDWKEDRLVPDVIKAASKGLKIKIRNPQNTRPWQHVLEPVYGYLLLGKQLLEEKKEFSGAWNFGPSDEGNRGVLNVVKELQKHWDKINYEITIDPNSRHEANLLKLDCSKASSHLNWKPVWSFAQMIEKTAFWYREYFENNRVISKEQLKDYIKSVEKSLE